MPTVRTQAIHCRGGATIAVAVLLAVAPTQLGGSRADAEPPPAAPVSSPKRAPRAKNVILLIADGAGYNTWLASSYYEGTYGREFFDGEDSGWTHAAVSTYPLRTGREPLGLTQDPDVVYDPTRAWDDRIVETVNPGRHIVPRVLYPDRFAGYRWHRETFADSANTATAMATGVKTFNNAINVDGNLRPLRTIAEIAHDSGRKTGTVTTVRLAHATPAALGGAHHASRTAESELANEMLGIGATGDGGRGGFLNLIVGCGHPEFDDNGRPVASESERDYSFVGGDETWAALREGCHATGWTLVETLCDIEALQSGATPAKLLIVPQVRQTLQQRRTGVLGIEGTRYSSPGQDPPIETVPTLPMLTRVALNALDGDPDGFYVMIEGGAVDWAMHDNQLGHMIEEMADFKCAVQVVIDWIECPGDDNTWDNTLVVVTADHDHLLFGPNSDTVAFEPPVDNGPGQLPGHKWQYDYHSNALVPLYAKGPGSELIAPLADRTDPVRGAYMDQTEVFAVLLSAMAP